MNRVRCARHGLAVGVVGILVVLTGCSSSSSSSSGGAPAGAGAPTGSGKTHVLTVASVAFSQLFGDYMPAIKARFAQANSGHEIPGYSLNYQGLIDDQYSVAGAVAAFREANEQDHVFAVVGNQSPLPPTAYVNQNHLPVIGGGASQSYCPGNASQSSYFFSPYGCQGVGGSSDYYLNLGQPAAAAVGGGAGKTAACVGEDFPNGAQYTASLCGSLHAAGFTVDLKDNSIPAPPAAVSDFSPYVQKIMTANSGKPVDVVGLTTSGTTGGLASALRRAGFKGLIIGGLGYSQAQTAAQTGVTQYINTASPMSASSNPQMKTIVDALVAAGVPANKISAATLQGWFAADMFVKIAQKTAASGPLTQERFAQTARTFTYQIPEVVGPTTYPTAFQAPTPCSELDQSNGTEWKVLRPYTCDEVFDVKTGSFVKYADVK